MDTHFNMAHLDNTAGCQSSVSALRPLEATLHTTATSTLFQRETLLWTWMLVSSPRMLAKMVSSKMSEAAERLSLLMFVALQKGVYGKKDADRSVYTQAER